jgi:heme oxygenase (biliverdin-IX-beta and delta-forming)
MISLSLISPLGGSQRQRSNCHERDRQLSWPNAVNPASDTYCSTSSRIEAEIREDYHRFLSRIIAYEPFSSREKYRHFLIMRFRFHHHIEPLYTDPILRRISVGLPENGWAALILQDMLDLDIRHVPNFVAKPTLPGGLIQRLGWLYFAGLTQRGTNALLEKAGELQLNEKFGARHLAQGNNRNWQAFTDGLDQLGMSEVEEERLYSGARSALSFANKLLNDE